MVRGGYKMEGKDESAGSVVARGWWGEPCCE